MADEDLVDWAFSCQHSIKEQIEKQLPGELHRWPIIKGFNAEGYVWNSSYLIVILRDEIAQIPKIGNTTELVDDESPEKPPSLQNIEDWQKYLRTKFSIRNQDLVMIIPLVEGKTIPEKWEKMSDEEKQLWHKQLSMNAEIQFYHLKGFDATEGFIVPPGYSYLTEECQQFLHDHPNYKKNVFIMMKFDNENKQLSELEAEVRFVLKENGFNPLRADDKVYPKDRDLWNNVCTYMICCKQGIALLENISKDEYNPNVAIEYGFMRALNKRALLLADKNFPRARADVVGKLREKFDIDDVKSSIPSPIEKWITEIEDN